MVELLVVLVLASLIFLVISSLTVVMFQTNNRSKQLAELFQAKDDLQGELSNNIRWAKKVTVDDSSHLIIQTADEPSKTIVYLFDSTEKTITKNGQRLVPQKVLVKDLLITDFSSSETASLEIIINLEHVNLSAVKDRLRLVVTQREGEVKNL